MRLLSPRSALFVVLSSALVLACGGGGDGPAAPPDARPVDTGGPAVDGGRRGDDAGPTADAEAPAQDAGTPGVDGGDGSDAGSARDSGTDARAAGDAGADSGAPADAGTDAGSAPDAGADGGTGTEPEPVRFVVLGDAGEGNEAQFMVAAAIENVCAARGCAFALYAGDNFYDDGVSAADDSQFQTKFELPYADIDFPFYVVLGNHDYGELSLAWEKASYEIAYTTSPFSSGKWTMPAEWYEVRHGNVAFFGLDTNQLMWDRNTDAQQAWLDAAMAASDADWKIVFGHHPYISNGRHGNAGRYEGLASFLPGSGAVVQDVMEESVCGVADVYFSGHDHNRQWLQSVCGTEFIVSGAGAKTTDFVHRDDNPVHFEDDTVEGFLWVEILGDRFTGAFYDQFGTLGYERSFTRTP